MAQVAGNRRLRVSSWVNPGIFVDASKITGKGKPDPDQIFVKNAMPEAVVTYPAKLPANAGKNIKLRVLDDAALLRTFVNPSGADGMKNISWDRALLPSLTSKDDDVRRQVFKRIINRCHKELGTLCLAGFTIIQDPGVANPIHDTFDAWLKKDPPDPSVDNVVDQLVKLSTTGMQDSATDDFFDGISFDIEGLTSGGSDKVMATMQKNFISFYQKLADALAPFGCIVALAPPAMISDTMLTDTVPVNDPKNMVSSRIQPYDLAAGRSNLLIRAQGYDAGKDGAALKTFHGQVVDYAVKKVGAANFQLGVKTQAGSGQVSLSDVLDRCTNLLLPNEVGISFFPTSASFWRSANDKLNPQIREAGRYVQFHPVQSPLFAKWGTINPRDQSGDLVFPIPLEIQPP
jgi:hypothetical protein